MTAKFSFQEKMILCFILLNVAAISSIPVINFSGISIYIVQLFFFTFILLTSLNLNFISRPIPINLNIFSFLCFLILILFLISSFYVNLGYNSEPKPILKLLTYPVVFYLFFFQFPKVIFNNDELFEKFLNFWIIFSVLLSILAFLMMFLGFNSNLIYQKATIAFLVHTNTFAFVFTFAVPMVIYKYFTKKMSFGLFIIVLTILLLCLLFTFSRAGYMGVFASILVLTYRKSKILLIGTMLILAILGSTLFLNFASAKTDSSFGRAQIAFAAYNMIFNSGSTRFLWGYGIFNNRDVFQKEIIVFGSQRDEQDPHNLFLLLGIQYGVPLTIVTFAAIIFLLVRAFLLKKRKIPFEFSQKVNLSISIMVGVLLQNMLEDIMIYPEYFVMPLFLVLMGYLYYSVYNYKSKLTS